MTHTSTKFRQTAGKPCAFYCCEATVDNYRSELAKLNCGKGCIRSRRLDEIPLGVIATILRDVAENLTKKPE